MIYKFNLCILGLIFSFSAEAALKSKSFEYKDGDTVLEGYLAYDDHFKGPRPAVLVLHDWMGLGHYAKMRADQLAGLGYIAMAADIYGKGVRPKDAKEAGEAAGHYKSNRKLLRERVNAAFNELKKQKNVNASKLGAIGYCFGGTTALELARSNPDVKAVVSFHGGLDTSDKTLPSNVKAHLLVLHGADDPFVPEADLKAFVDQMKASKVDMQFVSYANAVHSFTNPEAGNDNSKGAAYNELADKRSWQAMKDFFGEMFN